MEKTNIIILLGMAFFLLALPFSLASDSYVNQIIIGEGDSPGKVVITAYPSGGSSSNCIEDWSASFWSTCVDGYSTFVCVDRNQCGTISLRPEDCGKTIQCSSSSGGDDNEEQNSNTNTGSSSGGSSSTTSCIENWECSEWSTCINSIQTRTCSDSRNCGTTRLKPVLERNCSEEEQGVTSLNGTATSRPGLLGAVIGGGTASIVGLILFLALLIAAIIVFVMRKKKNPYNIKPEKKK
jgi:hypothetical protein